MDAPLAIGRPPAGHRFSSEAEKIRQFFFAEAQLPPMQNTQSESFQDVIGQLTGIG